MRIAGLIASIALLGAGLLALALSVGGGGQRSEHVGLAPALTKTGRVSTTHYAFLVRITRNAVPLSLAVHGQSSEHTISVRLKTGDVTLPDGRTLRGSEGAALLSGPFLYERAPSGVVVLGKLRWLRVRVDDLPPQSSQLRAVQALTPRPLLRVVGQARMERVGERLFRGTVGYDEPGVRGALARLVGGLEFPHLRVAARVGEDGHVRRVLLTGRTADGTTTLHLAARLFGFDKPLHVTPPAAGTFMDPKLEKLAA